MTYKKEICPVYAKYAIMIPVFYEFEEKPAWRTVYTGSLEDCKKAFPNYPDSLQATDEQNRQNRHHKRLEADFLQSIGRYKVAARIRENYKL